MDGFQLGKLVQWAGVLRSRKRVQKVIYLLQAAGCPYNADFFLHFYGPYSSDVAQLTDALVRAGLLAEMETLNQAGRQFEYTLPATAEASLTEFEQTPAGQNKLRGLRPFEDRARKLLSQNLSELEYASTVAYFKRGTASWQDALLKACKFKRLDAQGTVAQAALTLAKSIIEPAG